MFGRCRNCATSQQAQAEASTSDAKAREAARALLEDAEKRPSEPVKTPVATNSADKAEDAALKGLSQQESASAEKGASPKAETEAVPPQSLSSTWGSLPGQQIASAQNGAPQEPEIEATPVLAEISCDGACETPLISGNALSVVSDAGNKLMVVCAVQHQHHQHQQRSLDMEALCPTPVSGFFGEAEPFRAIRPRHAARMQAKVTANALSLSCDAGNKLMCVASKVPRSDALKPADAVPHQHQRHHFRSLDMDTTSESPAVCSNTLSMTCGVGNKLMLASGNAQAQDSITDAPKVSRVTEMFRLSEASAETEEAMTNGSFSVHAVAQAPKEFKMYTPASDEPRAARVSLNIEPLADRRGGSMKRASAALALRGQRHCDIARTPAGEGIGLAMVLLGDSVRVSALKPTGAVVAWNGSQRPRKQLLVGAIITAVNGISGDASAMRDALKSGDSWRISFRPALAQAEQNNQETDDDLSALDDAMSNSVHEVMSMASSFAHSVAVREELAMLQANDRA